MFTSTDKNLLIAAMESAIYHACVTANIVSLHAIETGVSSLRQRFDVDPASVSDAEVFGMVDTIERATIPKLTQISGLDNTTNIADRVVSFLWKNILEKPTTFPPSAHAHPWNEISSKPTTFPPSAHTHSEYAPISHSHSEYALISHTHEASAGGGTSVFFAEARFPGALTVGQEYVFILPHLSGNAPLKLTYWQIYAGDVGTDHNTQTIFDMLQRQTYNDFVSVWADIANDPVMYAWGAESGFKYDEEGYITPRMISNSFLPGNMIKIKVYSVAVNMGNIVMSMAFQPQT